MLKLSRNLIILIVLCFTFSQNAFGTGKEATQNDELECQNKLTRVGTPHKFEMIASLNAVKSWIEGAKKHGKQFAFWHKAEGGSVSCEKKNRSDYYFCHATGKPCPFIETTGPPAR